MRDTIGTVILPDGWTRDDAWIGGCVVLKHSAYGYTTIDFQRRIFGIGAGQPRPWRDGMAYSGKDWRKRIVSDAIANLITFHEGESA